MACENSSNYYPIVMKFSGYLLYIRTRVLLILDPIAPPAQQRCIYVDVTWNYVFTWTDLNQRKIHVNAT